MRVYVGRDAGDVPHGSTALDAIRALSEESAARVASGELVITDSRGLPISPDTAAFEGAIFRVVHNRDGDSAAQD